MSSKKKAVFSYVKGNRSIREEAEGVKDIQAKEKELRATKGVRNLLVVWVQK